MKLFNNRKKTTLLKRVRLHVVMLTLASFALCSLMTLFIVLSLEDAFFKEQLLQHRVTTIQGHPLPDGYALLDDLASFKISAAEKLRYIEFDKNFGEFKHNGKHYHFMYTDQGVLTLETSDIGIISRAIDDILLLMLIMLLPAFALTYWVSSKISEKALKPFTKIHQAISTKQYQTETIKRTLEDIDEEDIQLLASQLIEALDQQASMLEEQVAFNQGMAHEIRTPLQVMSNSMELIASTTDGIKALPAYGRLDNAILRMNRISSALLWLTSTSQKNHSSDVFQSIQTVLRESKLLLETHQVTPNVNKHHSLLLPAPTVVLELITLSLLTNVIHHSQTEEMTRIWTIDIYEQYISFSNPVTTTPNATTTQGFGLGLILIDKLAKKFSMGFRIISSRDRYQAVLSKTI